jgi:uncharacterized protein with HEPN domain
MTRDPKTEALLKRMAANEEKALAARRKRMAKVINSYVGDMDNGDLKELEDVLYPIVGRLEILGE